MAKKPPTKAERETQAEHMLDSLLVLLSWAADYLEADAVEVRGVDVPYKERMRSAATMLRAAQYGVEEVRRDAEKSTD